MMYLYLFLVALILAGATWGLVRLFGGKASFEGIFKLIATAFIMLPVIAVSLMLVAVAILRATGQLETVEGWQIWSWFPSWLWFVFGALSLFEIGRAHV